MKNETYKLNPAGDIIDKDGVLIAIVCNSDKSVKERNQNAHKIVAALNDYENKKPHE